MKKAVIYARYSCDRQSEQSIEGQLHVCTDYAKSHDILIVDTYIDRAMSGTDDMRPAFQKMLMDSAKKQWEIVLVYKLDRFSRNKYEATIHKHTLKENGVKLVSAMENIPDTPEGIILESLLEGMNQYYSAELRQKVIRGLKENWRKGLATGGRTVFGYDVKDKRYVINEYEAAIVREAFEMYAKGYIARIIAETFKERGYRKKNGDFINEMYIFRILHNQCYTGVVTRQGVKYDNIFPRIISDELWDAVSALTEENKQCPGRMKAVYGFILTGKLICGECKQKMVGTSGTSMTGDVHHYYTCHAKSHRHVKCSAKSIRKQLIEDLVIHHTVKLLNKPDIIHKIAETAVALHQKGKEDKTGLRILEKKLEKKKQAEANLVKAFEMGIFSETTKARMHALNEEIEALENEIDKEKARLHIDISMEEVESFLSERVFVKDCDQKMRKWIVATYIRQVILYSDHFVVIYNYTKNPDKPMNTIEIVAEVEKAVAKAEKTPFSLSESSTALENSSPFGNRNESKHTSGLIWKR